MRQYFFVALVIGIAAAIGGWALYMLGRAILQVVRDWKLGHELDELQAQTAPRREQRLRSLAERLGNGCDHDFHGGTIGLPPNACPKCGLEQEKPDGACDHIWRVKAGQVATSECERCGKVYHPLQSPSDLPQR